MGGFDHATTAHQHRTGRILSAHMAGNQPLNRQENPAETAYLHAITDILPDSLPRVAPLCY